MKFLLDVCAAWRTLQQTLSDLGQDVLSDRTATARRPTRCCSRLPTGRLRVLVTEDKDFGELVFLRRLPHPCIVRLVGLGAGGEQAHAVCLPFVSMPTRNIPTLSPHGAREDRLSCVPVLSPLASP